MGNFFVVTSDQPFAEEAKQVFQFGLDRARAWNSCSPDSLVVNDWCQAAHFPRQNGAGRAIACDECTRSCLLAIGTWFHSDGCASGEEMALLKRYLAVGPERLAKGLEGFFTIVIADGQTKEVVVLTDLVGSCHAFVRKWKGGFLVSASSFLLATLGDIALDPVACQEFLLTGTIYEDRTLYKEIRKLGPATLHRFGKNGEKSQRYWKIQDIDVESFDTDVAVKELAENLAIAARKIGKAFARPVCDLTGGYDSRATLSAFLNAEVSVCTTVTGYVDDPDVVVSRGLAEMLGLSHLNLNANEPQTFAEAKKAFAYTDGEYDLFEYARILEIHRELSKRFDISINGSFGEIARGYWWEVLFPHTGSCRPLDCGKIARMRYVGVTTDSAFVHRDLRLDMTSHLAGVLERTNAGLSELPNTVQLDHLYLMVRMQRWQGRIASSTNRLWPCLSPFLFRSVLEAMLRAKTSVRRFSFLIRMMLAEYQPTLAGFPLEHGYPAEPVTWKNIYRFWPVMGYYKKRVVSKTARLIAANCSAFFPRVATGIPLSRSSACWDDEVKELFSPGLAELRDVIDISLLRNRLDRAKDRGLVLNREETRLVTMEYTVRQLKRNRPVGPTFLLSQ